MASHFKGIHAHAVEIFPEKGTGRDGKGREGKGRDFRHVQILGRWVVL